MKYTEKVLIVELKSLEMIYFTNKVLERNHGKISKYKSSNKVTKQKCKDCLNFI